jgi:hypothetical protein
MRRAARYGLYKRFSRLVFSAVTGQTRVGVTVFVYSVLAVLLLAYVSAQIYAGVLRQEIAVLEQDRLDSRETLYKLTGSYVSLSSRARVSEYCESKLRMVRVGGDSFEVVAVADELDDAAPVVITSGPEAMPPAHGYTSRRSDRNIGQ